MKTFARFMAKVHICTDTGCWEWLGSGRNGYGLFWLNGAYSQSHRVAYAYFRERPAPKLVLHHRCENKLCVNPWHLEQMTRWENVARGDAPPAVNNRKTACPKGHLYDRIWKASSGSGLMRGCGICSRDKSKRRYDRLKREREICV